MQQGDNVFNSSEKLKWPFNLLISQQKPLLFLFFQMRRTDLGKLKMKLNN